MAEQDEQQEEQTSSFSDWREYRRQLAWEMVQKGLSQKSVAELLDVTQAAVSQWVKRAREQGQEALKAQPYPDRAKKLANEHIEKLRRMLAEGAEAHGFGDRWTTDRVVELIEEHFEITYHPAHISRLMRQWGFVWIGVAGWVMP